MKSILIRDLKQRIGLYKIEVIFRNYGYKFCWIYLSLLFCTIFINIKDYQFILLFQMSKSTRSNC